MFVSGEFPVLSRLFIYIFFFADNYEIAERLVFLLAGCHVEISGLFSGAHYICFPSVSMNALNRNSVPNHKFEWRMGQSIVCRSAVNAMYHFFFSVGTEPLPWLKIIH